MDEARKIAPFPFNTLQSDHGPEFSRWFTKRILVWKKEIPEYLRYYNSERPHMGLGMKTPIELLKTFPRY